ncbi:polysaccharide deacetylase family protein [Undibacterium piscinae]|uniref:Polysaccharide deacetylase family protein n=2 Tax=Undibacterium TaxID=401469 RepID=A0A6M4A5G3_9BURK|nr:polysaccharide deacetylase family protein [Undibacterium piscinae]
MLNVKIAILLISKYLGLFSLSRKLTSDGLRIFCYHGFSTSDEHLFRPKLFMTRDLFKQRLDKISKMGFTVLSLDNAVAMLKSGEKIHNSLVFTLDDGWQGVESIAWPLFKEHNFAWTLYLTTYYAEKQTQVMNVAVSYLLWKTEKTEIDLSLINGFPRNAGHRATKFETRKLVDELISFAETLASAEQVQDFVGCLASILGIDRSAFEKSDLFYLLNMQTVKAMHESGVDIQLHTHRHNLGGNEKAGLATELKENRDSIQNLVSHRLEHFCYPSGIYSKEYLPWLSELGIISATTCKPGLNYSTTPLLELNRFLDGENISAIEFEAELSGFSEILRRVRGIFSSNSIPG